MARSVGCSPRKPAFLTFVAGPHSGLDFRGLLTWRPGAEGGLTPLFINQIIPERLFCPMALNIFGAVDGIFDARVPRCPQWKFLR